MLRPTSRTLPTSVRGNVARSKSGMVIGSKRAY
jgi:hypothetical protein